MATVALPELGPWLGRLCNASASTTELHPFTSLDDIRLSLATGVLDLAGAARGFTLDDRAAIVGSLHARSWRQLWDKALTAAASRTADTIDAGFAAAALESRFPGRQLARLKVNPAERAAIAARLGAGAVPLEAALARLDELAGRAGAPGATGDAAFAAWSDGLRTAARQLEAAWIALETAVDREGARWQAEFARVRHWKRPLWPLWLASAVLIALAAWFGLMLGGYLPVADWFRPVAEYWWTHFPFA